MNRITGVLLAGAVLALAGCDSSTERRDVRVTNDQGDVVAVLPDNGTDYYVIRRECDGTTAIYTMKDNSGYDFQIVPGDPECAVAK
jgi:hypothetical protein